MAKVSVIIPVYNSGKYIKKCLDSLLNQTFKDFEAIIIDDGSIDNSVDIINNYLNDKRFILIKRKNGGIGSARNLGINKSTGKYITFLDSDDYLENDYLLELYNKIEKDKLDIVVCNYNEIKNNELFRKIKINEFNNCYLKNNPNLLLYINKSPWNKIYRKSIIKDIKFPEDLKYEDTVFVCKLLLNNKLGYLNKYLYNYVIHDKSETTTMDNKVFDIFKILDDIRNFYKNEDKNILEYLDKMIIQIITTYTIQQRYQKDKLLRNKFIDEAFIYLNNNIKDYKKNIYFKERKIKGIIEKSKFLTKIYCSIYNL